MFGLCLVTCLLLVVVVLLLHVQNMFQFKGISLILSLKIYLVMILILRSNGPRLFASCLYMVLMLYICVANPESCRRRSGNPSSPCFAAFPRLEADLFVCLFRHHARLPRWYPWGACTAACLKTRAAGVASEVCETI